MATAAIAERKFSTMPPNYMTPDILGGDWTKHPKFAAALDAGENSARQLAEAFTGLSAGHAEIVAQLRKDVKTKTPERHYYDTYDAAVRFRDNFERRCAVAREAAEGRIRVLDMEIETAMRCTDDKNTDKLRDRLYGMKPDERMAFARKSIDAGDRTKMAAFLNGDALLCGFTDAEQATLRTYAMEKHAAEPLTKKRNVEFAKTTVSDAFTAAIIAIGTLFPKERVEALQSELAELAAARDSITA